jgi:hypothetical protein
MIELKKDNIHRVVETDEEAKMLMNKGFILVDISNISNEDKKSNTDIDYLKLSIKELKKIAKEKGLAYSKLSKEELIKLFKK